MALTTSLASDLAGTRNGTRSALSPSYQGGYPTNVGSNQPYGGGYPTGAAPGASVGSVGNVAPTAPASTLGDPYAEAAKNAANQQSSFDLASALSSISGAPSLAALQQQSDYAGALAGLMGQDPTAGLAHAQAGLQQALLGLNQQQLGYDANTLHAQDAYANQLYGQAGKSYQSTVAYLNQLAAANWGEYSKNVGNYTNMAHDVRQLTAQNINQARLAEQQQTAGFTSDAVARGAMGASGTTSTLKNYVDTLASNVGQLTATGNRELARVSNERNSFIQSYKKQVASIANQRAGAKSDYTKAGLDTLERVQEINNALAKNALEVQADNVRKQQAAQSAQAAASTAAWQDAMGAMQYQNQQSGYNNQMLQERQNQFYNAMQLAPAINQLGVGNFLQQQGFSPQMMSGLNYNQIQDVARSLNQSQVTGADYSRFGFTPQQLSFFGLNPYMPSGGSVGVGGNRRVS